MDTADQLVDEIFSWIEQRERCAEQLRKLAKELESLREKCNASQCVGSTVSVVGAACLIGAGVATLFTGGAAAPFLGVLGAAYGGTGVVVSVATQLIEHFISSDTMKDAEKLAKTTHEIGEKIKQLFQRLMEEKEAEGSDEESDEEDRYVIDRIVGAMARRSRVTWCMNMGRGRNNRPMLSMYRKHMRLRQVQHSGALIGFTGMFTLSALQTTGKTSKTLFSKGAQKIVKDVSRTGLKTAAKGGAMVAGGAIALAFALPEAIDSWKEQVKNNHVTEASQSLRETAEELLNASQTLKEELNDIKRMFDEMADLQQCTEQYTLSFSEEDSDDEEQIDEDKGDNADRNGGTHSGCDEEHEHLLAYLNQEWENSDSQTFCVVQRSESDGDQERESDQQDEQSDGEEEEERESDQQDEQSDGEEERESDQQDEQSDGEEERESDQQEEEIDSEEERESDQQEEIDSEEERESDQNQKIDTKNDEGTDSVVSRQSDTGRDHENNPGVGMMMALLNIRSLTKKTPRILDLITENNLDVFLSTETWLHRNSGDEILRQASPANFNFYHQAREGRGGGVAIQYSNALQGRQIFFEHITTFEYVAVVLESAEWDAPVVLINVYFPPGYNKEKLHKFLNELQRLLNEILDISDNIILTGDFNIHVDNGMKSSSLQFHFLLLIYGFDQHVHEETHKGRHTLDLVITRNVEISHLSVQNHGISDHYTVFFNATPVSKDGKKKIKQKINGNKKQKKFKKNEE